MFWLNDYSQYYVPLILLLLHPLITLLEHLLIFVVSFISWLKYKTFKTGFSCSRTGEFLNYWHRQKRKLVATYPASAFCMDKARGQTVDSKLSTVYTYGLRHSYIKPQSLFCVFIFYDTRHIVLVFYIAYPSVNMRFNFRKL